LVSDRVGAARHVMCNSKCWWSPPGIDNTIEAILMVGVAAAQVLLFRTRSGRRAPPWDLQQYGVPTPHSDRLDASGGCDPDQRKDVAPHDRCRGPRL